MKTNPPNSVQNGWWLKTMGMRTGAQNLTDYANMQKKGITGLKQGLKISKQPSFRSCWIRKIVFKNYSEVEKFMQRAKKLTKEIPCLRVLEVNSSGCHKYWLKFEFDLTESY